MTRRSKSWLNVLFDDQRVLVGLLTLWTIISSVVCYYIMLVDDSPFLSFGPNSRTVLFGVKLDSWFKWWVVAIYTFVSTSIAAFASDSILPWITNTIQDHKTKYIPFKPWMCITIIQLFTIYAVIMSVIGLFVALSQIDFMFIRLLADLIVNHITTLYFVKDKIVNPTLYRQHMDSNNDQETSEMQNLCQHNQAETSSTSSAVPWTVPKKSSHDALHSKQITDIIFSLNGDMENSTQLTQTFRQQKVQVVKSFWHSLQAHSQQISHWYNSDSNELQARHAISSPHTPHVLMHCTTFQVLHLRHCRPLVCTVI